MFSPTCSGPHANSSLFICRNTLLQGASVRSSCVLNAKYGSILRTFIDCLFVLTVFCYMKHVVIIWGWAFVARSCSACPARRLSPLALRPAATLKPSPATDPVALPCPCTNRPLLLFLCNRREAGAAGPHPESWHSCLRFRKAESEGFRFALRAEHSA